MKRVLLVQPSLQPPGGANGLAAWMIEALKRTHAVSVLTWTPIHLPPINRYYGTSLSESDFRAHALPRGLRSLTNLVPLGFLKVQLLLSWCKKMKDQYDVIITANNEADFGCRGIQYIHFPRAYLTWLDVKPVWYFLSPALAHGYYRLCMQVSGFSVERMKQNLTLANSHWTSTKLRERYGIDATTVYPPVPGVFPEIPWEDREDGFVCIGRIAPEKELEKMTAILGAVRSHGWNLHLHIIGSPENTYYYRRWHRSIRRNASWIILEENLSRVELVRLLATHRYGIHGMSEEHFGMAVAEMVQAGCLVFVPRGGGQVEIVTDERLLYGTAEEAVTKIVQTMSDLSVQTSLRNHLASRKKLFSTQEFMRRIHEIVDRFGGL